MNRPARIASSAGVWLLRLGLSSVFIYAGIVKLRGPQAFADSIASFRLLPNWLIVPVALALPPLEIVAGILALVPGRVRRVGACGLCMMLLVFVAALLIAQARGLQVDCGCFGTGDILSPTKNLWIAISRDAVLGLAAGWLYWVACTEGNWMSDVLPSSSR